MTETSGEHQKLVLTKRLLMNQCGFQRLRGVDGFTQKVLFPSHLAINSLAYLMTSLLSKFTRILKLRFHLFVWKTKIGKFHWHETGTADGDSIRVHSVFRRGPSWQPLSQLIPSNCTTKNGTKAKTAANCCKNKTRPNANQKLRRAKEILEIFVMRDKSWAASALFDSLSYPIKSKIANRWHSLLFNARANVPKKGPCRFFWCWLHTAQLHQPKRVVRLREYMPRGSKGEQSAGYFQGLFWC